MDFEKILVATDFSDVSLIAVEKALSLALNNESVLYMLHVIEMPDTGENFAIDDLVLKATKMDASMHLEELVPANLSGQLVVEQCIRRGKPAREIIRFAQEKDIDTIVVGTHGRKGLSKLLVGSTAQSLLQDAPCQVLVVKPHQTTPRQAQAAG